MGLSVAGRIIGGAGLGRFCWLDEASRWTPVLQERYFTRPRPEKLGFSGAFNGRVGDPGMKPFCSRIANIK